MATQPYEDHGPWGWYTGTDVSACPTDPIVDVLGHTETEAILASFRWDDEDGGGESG